MRKFEYQYTIRYRIVKLDDTKYIFVPDGVLKGEEKEEGFKDILGKTYPYLDDKIDSRRKYYVDNEIIFADDELAAMYDYKEFDSSDESLKFLIDFFYDDFAERIVILDTKDLEKNSNISKIPIFLDVLEDDVEKSVYYMDGDIPGVVLNPNAAKEILECKKLKEVKNILTKYQRQLAFVKQHNKKEGITKICIEDNKVVYYETDRNIDFKELDKAYRKGIDISNPSTDKDNSDISYDGLRKYIKERVFGHDEEIDTFAQKLYMNYTALPGEPIDSVLFVGPTGVGKTETVMAACNYLDIPMCETNASNLVPQGYKGTSIEDVILELYEKSGRDIEKASRGIVFLDEYDKLNNSELDLKIEVKNILLTFAQGGTFFIDTGNYSFSFNSSMVSKLYAGVFPKVTDNKKKVFGFEGMQQSNKKMLTSGEMMRDKIIENKYLTPEELTRISSILVYNDLTREQKKDVLINCKHGIYAKKRDRLKRQFGIDLCVDEVYLDAILDKASGTTGMRSVNSLFTDYLNNAERAVIKGELKDYKKLVLTRDTIDNPNNFRLEK